MSPPTAKSDFPPAGMDQWRALAAKAAGVDAGDLDALLGSETLDKIAVKPLYGPATPTPVAALKGQPGWQVIQRIDLPEPARANKQALEDLEGGVTGLTFVVGGTPGARGAGLVLNATGDVERAFKDIVLDAIAVRLDARGISLGMAGHMIALLKRRGHSLDAVDCDLGLDPLSAFAAAGRFPANYAGISARLGDIAAWLDDNNFSGRLISADGRVWHEAGAGDALELACILASQVRYLRDLEAAGLSLERAAGLIGTVLVADDRQFKTIAKFRAARLLWARVLDACGIKAQPLHLHGETAWRMMAAKDAHLNLLRTTGAAFSAATGGANSLTVLPYSAALGLPDSHARRLARNIQLILAEEVYLTKVTDPAAGSGAVEHLTGALAHAAWDRFQAIEAQGGIARAIAEGRLQDDIKRDRTALIEAYGSGVRKITGVTGYINPDNAPPAVLKPGAGKTKKPVPRNLPAPGGGTQFAAILALAEGGVPPQDLLGKPPAPPIEIEAVTGFRVAEAFETGGRL